jgi:hypothetical protein
MSEQVDKMRATVGCSHQEVERVQTDFWVPSVLSLRGCTNGSTSCGRCDLFLFALSRRLVAASV